MSTATELDKQVEAFRSRAEARMISAMYDAALKASPTLELFSQWQLIAQAASASLLVANADRMVELLSKLGFLVCGGILLLSAAFGIFSKTQAVFIRMRSEVIGATKELVDGLSKDLQAEEEQLYASADAAGSEIDVSVRFDRVISSFLSPLPRWAQMMIRRSMSKQEDWSHPSYYRRIRGLYAQSVSALIQTVLFLTFFGAALMFAATSIETSPPL